MLLVWIVCLKFSKTLFDILASQVTAYVHFMLLCLLLFWICYWTGSLFSTLNWVHTVSTVYLFIFLLIIKRFFFWRYCSLYSDCEWTFDFRNVVGFCSKGYFLYTRFHQIEPCMVVIFSSFVTWSFFVPYADWGLIWYRNFVYFSKNAIQWCYQLCRDVLYLYPSHAGCLSWCSKSWHDTPMDRWSPLLVCSCYHGVDDISCLSSSIPDKNWKLVCSGSRCRPSTTCGQGKMKKKMSAGLYTGLFLYLVYIYVSCR